LKVSSTARAGTAAMMAIGAAMIGVAGRVRRRRLRDIGGFLP
jgi:hypothetical protein